MARMRRNGWKNVVALLAAVFFALQSLASAQAARPVLLDVFGNPICVTAADADHSVPQRGGHADENCCLLGCGAPGAALADQPAAFAADWRYELPATYPPLANISLPVPGHRPGNPRAPPLTD